MTDADAVTALARSVQAGDRRAIGKAITLVESELPADRARAAELLNALAPSAGRALRVGVTGAPGVGKSTLIDAFGRAAIAAGRRVAVLAIDPSSMKTGGSLLGDRTRMGRLAASSAAFVRPSPSRGAAGGVGRRTREASIVLEAAGYDLAIVETVGVGQGELAVTDVVDVLLVLWMAGAGDDVQSIKRGILEHADLVVFTKADGDNAAAARAARDRLDALFSAVRRDAPAVLAVSAFDDDDARRLWEATLARHDRLMASGEIARRRHAQRRAWFREALEEALAERMSKSLGLLDERARLEAAMDRGELLPPAAARQLLSRL